MKIASIHHCSFLVADLERSLDFYSGLLGLAANPGRPDLGYPGAWLDVGEQQIHLMQLPDPYRDARIPEHGGRDRHLALKLEGIGELEQRLEQAGIAFTKSRSGRAALFCRDPDGNALEFIGA